MKIVSMAADLAAGMSSVMTGAGLFEALSDACDRIGVRYFALSHHVDFAASPGALRLHNYPDGWQDWYDGRRMALSDPIHRASQCTAASFLWEEVHNIIPLSQADRRLLRRGREIGLGSGVTVPANVPGEAHGSCTFVSAAGADLPDNALLWAQALGMCAFEIARRLHRQACNIRFPRISDRQRECIALAGRGLSDRGIANSLGIGEQSVKEHMREARARLGVATRTQLVVSLLFARQICLDDVHPLFTL